MAEPPPVRHSRALGDGVALPDGPNRLADVHRWPETTVDRMTAAYDIGCLRAKQKCGK